MTITLETELALVAAIVKEVQPEKIILFGSQARGDAGEASDIDLLIIDRDESTNGSSREKWEVLQRIRRVLAGFHGVIDVLIFSQTEAAYWQTAKNHVVARAFREGKVIYE